jgi:PhzF family phenazine biosynthesis protein
MNKLITYIVDSFTNEPFKGNPAGVCLTEAVLENSLMLSIAKELGLSETAFVLHTKSNCFDIRFFSPKMEIPLCGHATLAASNVLFERIPELNELHLRNIQNIDLEIRQEQDQLIMKFPLYKTRTAEAPDELCKALGIHEVINVEFNQEMNILLIEMDDSEKLRLLNPDFEALKKSHELINGVLVTSKSKEPNVDFESRYFWPWSGTNEDPVTGGTHTFLTPYWAKRLKKNKMTSFQCSERTGQMELEIISDNWLTIKSTARIVFEGAIRI